MSARMYRAALAYAERGLAVFPCRPRDKTPLTEHGSKDATREPDQIGVWWKRWPDGNVAIATGATSGLFVLDVDPRHGGDESLAALEAEHSKLPDTPIVLTGGGGLQFYFHLPQCAEIHNSAGVLGLGLDVRGHGGYVIAPPSIHPSGNVYRWEASSRIDELALADPPAWLVDLLICKPREGRETRFEAPPIFEDGSRNDFLFRFARSQHARHRLSLDEMLALLLAVNQARCKPPLDRSEVEQIARNGVSEPDRPEFAKGSGADAGNAEHESQATQLVKLAQATGAKLFHDGDDCLATVVIRGHAETYALRSRAMRRWLTHLFFERAQKAPAGDAVRSAIETLSGCALFKGEERKTFVRVASHDSKLYLDLCNAHWQMIEVAPQGWRVIESKDCPVRFRRSHGMQALPMPERGGSVADLRPFLNVATDADFKLVVGWLLSCYRDRGPYPLLVEHGEQGSAKTTTARVLRDLVDPNSAALRSGPRDERDLMIAARNGWVIALDNLSHLPAWLSDALCRLATGGGLSTRELYTDADEIIFDAQRPGLLTGIEELATRGDLLDRAIVIYLPRITEENRLTEETFNQQFNAARPRILGAVLDAISCGQRGLNRVKMDRLPRMADFAVWVEAAAPSLGWEPGSFLSAYTGNREAANALALDASPVAAAIQRLDGDFQGSATELLAPLNALVDDKTLALKTWPRSGRALSNAMRRIAPNLAAVGIEVTFEKPTRKTGGRRLITITRRISEHKPSSPSTPSTPGQQNQPFFGDDSGDDAGRGDGFASPPSTPEEATKSRGGDIGDGGDAKIAAVEDEGLEL